MLNAREVSARVNCPETVPEPPGLPAIIRSSRHQVKRYSELRPPKIKGLTDAAKITLEKSPAGESGWASGDPPGRREVGLGERGSGFGRQAAFAH